MFTGKDIHMAWAYAENKATIRKGFHPYERQSWGDVPEESKAKYQLMAEFLNDRMKALDTDDIEAELRALERLDQFLASDEETSNDNEEIAKQDCPMCPEEDMHKIGYDFFGGICRIDGTAVCYTCYCVHQMVQSSEEGHE